MSAVTLETLRAAFNGLVTVADCETARAWLSDSMEPLFDDLKHCAERQLSPRAIRAEIERRKTLKWNVSQINSRLMREDEERRLSVSRVERLQSLTPDQLMAEALAEKRAQYAFEAERNRIRHEQKMERISANNAPFQRALKALKKAIRQKYGADALAELLEKLPQEGAV